MQPGHHILCDFPRRTLGDGERISERPRRQAFHAAHLERNDPPTRFKHRCGNNPVIQNKGGMPLIIDGRNRDFEVFHPARICRIPAKIQIILGTFKLPAFKRTFRTLEHCMFQRIGKCFSVTDGIHDNRILQRFDLLPRLIPYLVRISSALFDPFEKRFGRGGINTVGTGFCKEPAQFLQLRVRLQFIGAAETFSPSPVHDFKYDLVPPQFSKQERHIQTLSGADLPDRSAVNPDHTPGRPEHTEFHFGKLRCGMIRRIGDDDDCRRLIQRFDLVRNPVAQGIKQMRVIPISEWNLRDQRADNLLHSVFALPGEKGVDFLLKNAHVIEVVDTLADLRGTQGGNDAFAIFPRRIKDRRPAAGMGLVQIVPRIDSLRCNDRVPEQPAAAVRGINLPRKKTVADVVMVVDADSPVVIPDVTPCLKSLFLLFRIQVAGRHRHTECLYITDLVIHLFRNENPQFGRGFMKRIRNLCQIRMDFRRRFIVKICVKIHIGKLRLHMLRDLFCKLSGVFEPFRRKPAEIAERTFSRLAAVSAPPAAVVAHHGKKGNRHIDHAILLMPLFDLRIKPAPIGHGQFPVLDFPLRVRRPLRLIPVHAVFRKHALEIIRNHGARPPVEFHVGGDRLGIEIGAQKCGIRQRKSADTHTQRNICQLPCPAHDPHRSKITPALLPFRDFDRYVKSILGSRFHRKCIMFRRLKYLCFSQGNYARCIEEYLRYFPKENMKFVFFEEMIRDEQGTVEEILDFIQVERDARINYDIKSNESVFCAISPLRSKLIYACQGLYYTLIDFLHLGRDPKLRYLIRKFFHRIRVFCIQRDTDTSRMLPQTRQILNHYYKEEVARLEEIVGRKVPESWGRTV